LAQASQYRQLRDRLPAEYFAGMAEDSPLRAWAPTFRQYLPISLLLGTWTVAIPAYAADPTVAGTQQVLEHHGDAARSGLYVLPDLTWAAAAHLQRDPKFQAVVGGPG